MSQLKRFAVFGNPIAHSKSPIIHQAFAQSLDIELVYERRLAPVDGFAQSVESFFAEKGIGANVTLPFKEQAFDLCQVTTQRAKVAGAVNTLWQQEGVLHGDNTDGLGLVKDMTANLGWQLSGKHMLILGAGGAVRGIIEPLVAAGIASITVANRTLERAQHLANDMAAHKIAIDVTELAAIKGQYDVVINAISAGLKGEMPPLPSSLVSQNGYCYDLLYANGDTPFIAWAKQQGIKHTADGLGMLVEQAAASFNQWLAASPQTLPVIRLLKEQIPSVG